MPIELDDRGQALENEYFRKQEQELIAKMKAKLDAESSKTSKLKPNCPVTDCGGALHEVDFEGVKIDACGTCGGVWLDAGELAQIVGKDKDKEGWFHRLLG